MTHPKDRVPPLSRREFLRRAAATGVAVPSLAAFLAACGSSGGNSGGSSSSPSSGGLQLARPDSPVTLPVTADNPSIADGLSPEAGPLKVFGYSDYIYKKVLNTFKDRYGVNIEWTIFDTPDEMISKMLSNGSDFDMVVTVTLENIGKLATGGIVQPLNKTYLPTVQDQLWTGVPDYYDVGRQYSVPYVAFTTGISWRNDLITTDIASMDNPYDIFWDTANKGQVHLLNGSRDTLATALLRGGYDPNTDDTAVLDTIRQDLLDGANAMGWKYDHVDYTELSTNGWEVHGTWSGQMVYYQYYLPKGLDITSLSYSWPPQGTGGQNGLISHDMFAISKGAANPVLAHKMIDFMYEPDNSLANYQYEGYQPTVKSLDKQTALDKGYLPPSLDYTFVTEDMFAMGVSELELAPAVNQLYQQIYQEVTGGA